MKSLMTRGVGYSVLVLAALLFVGCNKPADAPAPADDAAKHTADDGHDHGDEAAHNHSDADHKHSEGDHEHSDEGK